MITMINESLEYEPQYPVAPGITLAESLAALQISPVELAQRTQTTLGYVNGVLAGKLAVTVAFAEALTKIIDVPADFWLRYDADYWRLKSAQA